MQFSKLNDYTKLTKEMSSDTALVAIVAMFFAAIFFAVGIFTFRGTGLLVWPTAAQPWNNTRKAPRRFPPSRRQAKNAPNPTSVNSPIINGPVYGSVINGSTLQQSNGNKIVPISVFIANCNSTFQRSPMPTQSDIPKCDCCKTGGPSPDAKPPHNPPTVPSKCDCCKTGDPSLDTQPQQNPPLVQTNETRKVQPSVSGDEEKKEITDIVNPVSHCATWQCDKCSLIISVEL